MLMVALQDNKHKWKIFDTPLWQIWNIIFLFANIPTKYSDKSQMFIIRNISDLILTGIVNSTKRNYLKGILRLRMLSHQLSLSNIYVRELQCNILKESLCRGFSLLGYIQDIVTFPSKMYSWRNFHQSSTNYFH